MRRRAVRLSRRNPDVSIRELERMAAGGDLRAQEALEAMRSRLVPSLERQRVTALLQELTRAVSGGAPARPWKECMDELVDAALDLFGPSPEALGAFFLSIGHPGLDWVYRRMLSPWAVDELYDKAVTEAVREAGVPVHQIGGMNYGVRSRPRHDRYTVSLDVYFQAETEDQAELAATEIDSALSDRDEEMILRHAPGLESDYWDVEIAENEYLEDEETYDVHVIMEAPFALYHLFAMLDLFVSFEPLRKTKKKKVRRRRR